MSDTTTKPAIDPAVQALADKFDRSVARFQARYLHALEPIIRSAQECESWSMKAGLIVEPCDTGGVILVATDGVTLAVIHDPKGRATRVMRITIEDGTFEAVTPRPPVTMWSEGEPVDIPQPDWAQPGIVMAWGLACGVFPVMHLPGADPRFSPLLHEAMAEEGNEYTGRYRIHADPPALPWRKMLGTERGTATGCIHLFPHHADRFTRMAALLGTPLQFNLGDPKKPILISAPGHPEFIGAVMPAIAVATDDPIPIWARL